MFYRRTANYLECSAEDEYLIIFGHEVKEDEMYSIYEAQKACRSSKLKRSFTDWLLRPSIAARKPLNPTVSLRGPGAYSYSCDT